MPNIWPRQDRGLCIWARNFTEKVNAQPAKYSIKPEQAAELAALYEFFAEALRVATEPATRTRPAIAAKDAARQELFRRMRPLANLAFVALGQDSAAKVAAGFKPGMGRSAKRSRIKRPQTPPIIDIRDVRGSRVTISLRDAQSPTRTSKLAGIDAATIFTFIGEQPPTERARWRLQTHTSRNRVTLQIKDGVTPGVMLWICARWMNRRGEPGPVSNPVSTRLSDADIQFPSVRRAAAA